MKSGVLEMLKKILSLLMALIMVGSALVFCAAETEVKVDVRLDVNNETREVDMVFSIPENANLSEFSFDIYYHFDTMSIASFAEQSFENNLSPEEKEFFDFAVNTDALNRVDTSLNRPYCTVEGFAKDNYALNKGGDIFTLKFTLAENLLDCNFGFTFDTEFILNGDRDFYDEAIVPSTLNYFIQNQGIVDYHVTYSKFIATTSLEQINEQSKKAHTSFTGNAWTDFSGTQRWHPIANSPNASECTNIDSSSWTGGAWIPVQSFQTTSKYVRYLSTHIYISSVSAPAGQAYLTYRIRTNADAANNNILFGNNWAPSATNGWHTWDISGTTTIPTVPTGTTYYFQWAWTHPNYAGTGTQFIMSGKAYGTYMYYGGGLYEFGDHVWPFQVLYDNEAQTFENRVNAATGTAATTANGNALAQALSAYNALDNNNIKNNANISSLYSTYQSRKSTYDNNVKNAANAFITAVNNIGTSVTANELSAITSARTTYTNLCTDAKNYSGVSDALTKLEHQEAASPVVSAINSLGTITWAKKSDVESAKSSYDALDTTPKGYVGNYSTLTEAETTIGNMQTALTAVETAYNNCGTASDLDLNDADRANVAALREAYDNVTAFGDDDLTAEAAAYLERLNEAETRLSTLQTQVDAFKEDVANISPGDMTAVEELLTTYNGFTDGQKALVEDEYIKLTVDYPAAFNVMGLIDACYPVDMDKEDEISAAVDAYALLTDDQKAMISDEYKNKLTEAQTTLSEMQTAVANLITAIDTIESVDLDDETLIIELTGIYNGMTDLQKEAVTNSDLLTNAALSLAQLKTDVADFIAYVESIGQVDVNDLEAIVNAENLYDQFTDGQKEAVADYVETLTAAREAIDLILDKITALDEEIALIEKPYDVDDATAINSAKEKYDDLTDAEKALLENEQDLLDAIDALAAAQEIVDNMEAQIDALYPIDLDDEDAITAAETNFEALTDAQKLAVENAYKLDEARETYEQMVADVEAFKSIVNGLGDIDLDDNDNIVLAETLYANFTDLQKAQVTDEYSALQDARVILDALWDEVNTLIADIDAIGEVELDDEPAILDARDVYDNQLTQNQQNAVSNYNVLVAAEEALRLLKLQQTTGSIVASNNLAATQTVQLVFGGKNAISGYYFGTNEDYTQLDFVATTETTVTEEITAAGTYCLTVVDEFGNISKTTRATFVDVTLDAQGGNVAITNLLIKQNNYLALPTPTKENCKFMGWARSEDALSGNTVVDVENGGTFYAVWVEIGVPAVTVTSTNNMATSQTVTVSVDSEETLAGYYFGTNANHQINTFVATSNSIFTQEIIDSGVYYVTVEDAQGVLSATIAITFYKTTLDANTGSVSIPYVITKAGNSITLPDAVKAGNKCLGWSTGLDVTSGVNVIAPTSDETYYAVWTEDTVLTAKVGSVTGAKKGDRIEIPVSMDKYDNAYASIFINKVEYDIGVLSFVSFAVPTSNFISRLAQTPVINNEKGTYSLVNTPSNAVDAYYTSGGVVALLVFDVLQDINQYSAVSVGFDRSNTSVFVNGAADGWTETKKGSDVLVSMGGVLPKADNQNPTASVSVTQNISNTQTVTVNMFDDTGISGYYWGTSDIYNTNTYVSGTKTVVNKTVNTAGTYYLTVVDQYGNLSETVEITFCSVVLNTNVENPAQLNLILEKGSTVILPVYEKEGYSFQGWSQQADSGIGITTLTVAGNAEYYGIFTNDSEKAQSVIDMIDAVGEVTLAKADAIYAARAAYDSLSDSQKLMVTNYSQLQIMEEILANLSEYTLGDVDKNGQILAGDVIIALQGVVGKIVLSDDQILAADVDLDKQVTFNDVLYILQKVAGKATIF